MKLKMLTTLLLSVLLLLGLCGCSPMAMARGLDAAEDAVENRLDMAEQAVENRVEDAIQTMAPNAAPAEEITKERAQEIALEHAGFTADQVKNLRTDYEIDDGKPRYEVQFRQDRWEYDYEINAQTGDILSYDRDD